MQITHGSKILTFHPVNGNSYSAYKTAEKKAGLNKEAG
jgi:hypothetical protein